MDPPVEKRGKKKSEQRHYPIKGAKKSDKNLGTMKNTNTTLIVTLGLTIPCENFLSGSKDGHRIEGCLPFDESCPLIPKVFLPILFGVIVWKVKLEIEPVYNARLDDFTILRHQFFHGRALPIWRT